MSIRLKRGFTLIELLIVISILAILTLTVIFAVTQNLARSRDGKRKSDLDRIKIALQESYDDNNVYPDATVLNDCGGSTLRPYLSIIPCDPKLKSAYCYLRLNNGQSFRVFARLENDEDQIIQDLGCNTSDPYCGYEEECSSVGYSGFNYGVSSGDIAVANPVMPVVSSGGGTPNPPPPEPLPSSVPGIFACTPLGQCDGYEDPSLPPHNCPITFSAGGPGSQCANYCAKSNSARCEN